MKDFRGFTFTNGEKVDDWLSTLSLEDRDRAEECIVEMCEKHIPLNFLQVKIRMTSPRRKPKPDFSDETPSSPSIQETKTEPRIFKDANGNDDYYHSHTPYRPRPVAPKAKPEKRIPWWMSIIAVFVVLALAAIVTNPSEQRHQEAIVSEIRTAFNELIEEHTENDNGFGGIMSSMFTEIIGSQIFEALATTFLDHGIEYRNYWLFSECVAKIHGEDQIISIGLFGMVFTFEKDEIKQFVEYGLSQTSI